ncbi:hypothetical protein AVEN_165366-1 [Araneus ventricosus]|uniref:Uncharacterized protein n=1 Tax=Araneus ventricosus TaxID=182803 RepID=A0A4Y2AV58_ARAVE|nr:hypothetical protein AVEN_165366-1 [Araneus ventricosus]
MVWRPHECPDLTTVAHPATRDKTNKQTKKEHEQNYKLLEITRSAGKNDTILLLHLLIFLTRAEVDSSRGCMGCQESPATCHLVMQYVKNSLRTPSTFATPGKITFVPQLQHHIACKGE